MTEQEIENEYNLKAADQSILRREVLLKEEVPVVVFADGTAYSRGAIRGKFQKFWASGIWDWHSPDGRCYSKADKEHEPQNKILETAWRELQAY